MLAEYNGSRAQSDWAVLNGCAVDTDCIESAVATLVANLEACAWKALCDGNEALAEEIEWELIAARVEFADVIGCCD